MKKRAKHKEAHSSNTKFGMGDFYGDGIRNKIGRIRDSYVPNINPLSPKQLSKAPKKLA